MENTLLNKWIAVLIVIVLTASCNRKFDVPPANADPEIDANLSIRDLKARYTAIGNFQRIEEEHIISGIVIADDRSGNFYKQIVIQDETGVFRYYWMPIMFIPNILLVEGYLFYLKE